MFWWRFSRARKPSGVFSETTNIARIDVVNYISHGISRYQARRNLRIMLLKTWMTIKSPVAKGAGRFAVNLNRMARDGKIDPLIGREYEVNRLIQTLARRRKSNLAGGRFRCG